MAQAVTNRVLKAMSVFGGVQVVSILCSVVRAKLIAIWIGPIGVGLFGIFNSVIEMLSGVTQLNMRQSAVRNISRYGAKGLPRMTTIVRWWALRLGLLGLLVTVVLSPVLSIISFGNNDYMLQFCLLALCLLAISMTNGEQALMQGAERLKKLASSQVWSVLLGTVLSLPLFYFYGADSIVPSLLLMAFVTLIASRMSNMDMRACEVPRKDKIKEGKEFLKLGAYLTISSLAATGASYVFLSYLNNVADTQEVGVYQAGYTLSVKYVGLVFTALAMEYYPRLAKVAHRRHATSAVVSHEVSLIMCILTVAVTAFVFLDEFMVEMLYDSEFLAAVPMVTIGVCGALFRGVSYCMSYVIVARGDGKAFVATDVLSASIGLALNIVCYKQWGLVGLGISYVAWYAIYTLIVAVVYFGRYKMTLSRSTIFISLMSIAIVATAVAIKSL